MPNTGQKVTGASGIDSYRYKNVCNDVGMEENIQGAAS
jgi:hypothetical protein